MRHPYFFTGGICLLILSLAMGCDHLLPPAPAENEVLDGPVAGLSAEQHTRFLRGDRAFNDEIFTAQTGLGPLFVAASCGSCHAGDGKGHPFTTLTRFGQTDSTGNPFLAHGGPQLQHRAVPPFTPEQLPAGVAFSRFMPPANTGLGLLELVSDADLLALADPTDSDGDGISGVPNWIKVPDYVSLRPGAVARNGKYIGRFGKKAGVYDLLQQTANAYNQDMGITSVFEPHDTYTGRATDPEVSTQTVEDVGFYLQTLKAPQPRHADHPEVQAGKALFSALKCSACHQPVLKTGYSPVASLAWQTIYPYTDLLLHDMGSGLDDGYTEGNARTYEWRTPPLWGLGLSAQSQGGAYFLMHDGRATSIEAAILLHGGEALGSRERYQSLTATEKNALIRFLESL